MIMLFLVTVPDDTVKAERVNYETIEKNVEKAVIKGMILEKKQKKEIKAVLRSIKKTVAY